jgi:hypothetical protein
MPAIIIIDIMLMPPLPLMPLILTPLLMLSCHPPRYFTLMLRFSLIA